MRMLLRRLAPAALLLAAIFACSDETSQAPKVAPPPSSKDDSGAPPSPTTNAGDGAAVSPDGAPPEPEIFVNVTNETFEFGGRTRTYLLAKPVDYDASKSYPLVLSFHGSPGLASDMAKFLPFDSVSKKEAVIAYPQAASESWDLYTVTDNNADMYFIEALPAEIKANKANVDMSRIYGFGYSGGAFFITQFTCRFGGIFKAISVNSGGGPDEAQMGYDQHPNGCYVCPGGPIATIVTHGALDTEVEPASGDFTKACYATTNACGSSVSAATPAPCEQYDGCPAGKPVKWCLIPGQGHGIWDNAISESWTFFKSIP